LFFAGALCKSRELLPCDARAVTFEQANNLGGRIFRWSTDEAMHMINICFQREQCEAVGQAAISNCLLDDGLNLSRQTGVSKNTPNPALFSS